MSDYHKMIYAHGILGAIAFLGLVPMSILLIRYYSRWNPFWAFKLHVWCQVLTLFLSTIIFVLGWFAVGPKRSLSNPHHGMGLAIYVVVIFQFFWGYFVHKVERNRKSFHVPLKLVVSTRINRPIVCFPVTNLLSDPSVDGVHASPTWYRSDTTGSHFVWLTQSAIHIVCNCCLYAPCGILCAVIFI